MIIAAFRRAPSRTKRGRSGSRCAPARRRRARRRPGEARPLHARPMRSCEQEGRPRCSMVPASRRRKPARQWSNVVVPAPRAPSMATHSPSYSSSVAPRSTQMPAPSIPPHRRRSSSTGSGREGRATRSNDGSFAAGSDIDVIAERTNRRADSPCVRVRGEASFATRSLIDVTSGGCRAGGRSSRGRPHYRARTAS